MTAETTVPLFTPTTGPKRWVVTLADNTTRTIEAHGFRCEHGALVLVLPVGSAAAFASGVWQTCEPEVTPWTSSACIVLTDADARTLPRLRLAWPSVARRS